MIILFLMIYRIVCIIILCSLSIQVHGNELIAIDTNKPRIPKIPIKITDTVTVIKSKKNIVVTGTRNEVVQKDSPVRVEVISQEQVNTSAMVNIGDLLKEQNGIALTTNVRTGVQIMGLSADYTQILIDGQPMIGRVAGVLDLSRISVGNIDRVEIVKGPMSSLYGSEALAGVINIITKKPEIGFKGSIFGQIIQKGAQEYRAELQYGSEKFDFSTFVNYKNSLPFTLEQSNKVYPYQGFTDYTLHTKMKWFAQNNLKIGADFRGFMSDSKGKFVESFFGQIASNTGSVVQKDIGSTISAEWTHGKARLSAQVYASSYGERYNFDSIQGSGTSIDDMSRNLLRSYLQYDVFWSEKNRYTFGTEYTIDDISGTRYPDKPSFRTFSGFMQWEGNPTSWISYALSARYVQNSAYKNPEFSVSDFAKSIVNIINPKYSLNIKATEHIRLNSSIGTGFKVPDFRQLYVQFSNRLGGAGYDLIGSRRLGIDLQPERSIAYDIGLIYDNQSLTLMDLKPLSVFFECRYFINQLSNLIEFYFVKSDPISNQSIYSYRNISRALTSGIDISTRWIFPLSKTDNQSLGISIGYQYLDTRDLEVDDAIQKGIAGTVSASNGTFKPLTENEYGGLWFRSKHTGTIRLEYNNPENGFSCNIRAQMIGRFGDEALDNNGPVILNRKVPDLDNEYVQGYTIINAAMSKEFNISEIPSTLMLSIGINNALNSMNLQSIPNMIGRQVFVNSSIRL